MTIRAVPRRAHHRRAHHRRTNHGRIWSTAIGRITAIGCTALLFGTALLGALLIRQPAQASAPLDHRPTTPNHSSELPGAGYLLTDPLQGGSHAYWAGAYRTIAGQRSYCIDDFYDYPNPSYHYLAPEVASWPARLGSNNGAHGRAAQRISWIVNSFGQSSAASVDAAVSMAINLLSGSTPFRHSYLGYFRAQLGAIDPAIVTSVDRMISDSERYAGPYTTRVSFGPSPVLHGTGQFSVEVRSGAGIPVPGAQFRILATAGLRLRSPAIGRTGSSGIATLRYLALASGPVGVIARGLREPNTTIRLGYSPSHYPGNFRTGSQRVALASGHPYVPVPPGHGGTVIAPPAIHTTVQPGTGARPAGSKVTDLVQGTGLLPRAEYLLQVRLQDGAGFVCGSAASVVRADARGRFSTVTPSIAVCGGGRDTFVERLIDTAGRPVAASPPGQPSETFPITPIASTAVIAGTGPRTVGSPVSDRVTAAGLPPLAVYRVRASLLDSTGRLCGSTVSSARSDAHGWLESTTAALTACGTLKDTFTEQLTDSSGNVLASTPAWQPTETFPLALAGHNQPPPAKPLPTPKAKPTPSPRLTPKPAYKHPAAVPVPRLAVTGSTPRLALLTGLVGLLAGGVLMLAGRRAR